MELQQLKKELLTKSSDHRDLSFDFNILAKHVLKVKDDELNPFTIINEAQAKKIRRLMKKHLHGIPIQKMIGYSIFHDCYIPYSKHTLTPRLETELLVEKILETINHKKYKVFRFMFKVCILRYLTKYFICGIMYH